MFILMLQKKACGFDRRTANKWDKNFGVVLWEGGSIGSGMGAGGGCPICVGGSCTTLWLSLMDWRSASGGITPGRV